MGSPDQNGSKPERDLDGVDDQILPTDTTGNDLPLASTKISGLRRRSILLQGFKSGRPSKKPDAAILGSKVEDVEGVENGLASNLEMIDRQMSLVREADRSLSALEFVELARNDEIPSLVVSHDVNEEGEVTNPDIGAVIAWSRDELALVEGFIEELNVLNDQEDTVCLPEERLALTRAQRVLKKLPMSDQTLVHLHRNNHYLVAWWNSHNSLVRLWGQLNAGGQVLEDEVIFADLRAVLGKDFVVTNDVGNTLQVVFDMVFVRQNRIAIMEMIRQKYAGVNLDAIIARKLK